MNLVGEDNACINNMLFVFGSLHGAFGLSHSENTSSSWFIYTLRKAF